MTAKFQRVEQDVPDEFAKEWGFAEHDGYSGFFTRKQSPGAIENGTTIVKVNSERGDATPDGARGVVLGSMPVPNELASIAMSSDFFYFVEWDHSPRTAVGVLGFKVRIA